jgi:hypothetical protein
VSNGKIKINYGIINDSGAG